MAGLDGEAQEHLEHSIERIGSDTRAYHSLTTNFVWDVPDVYRNKETCIVEQLSVRGRGGG